MSANTAYSLIADFVLVIHFGIVAFVVLGLVAVSTGTKKAPEAILQGPFIH